MNSQDVKRSTHTQRVVHWINISKRIAIAKVNYENGDIIQNPNPLLIAMRFGMWSLTDIGFMQVHRSRRGFSQPHVEHLHKD